MNLGLGTTGVDPKGLGCRPETFLWRIPARYGGKGATDTWSRGTSAPCMWLPCKRQCCTNIQIYKYKYTNTNWIWLARVPLTHEADAATHRGGTSAPCMWLLCKRQHCLYNRTKSSSAVAEAGKIFIFSFKSKDAVLDDMFTFAEMQTSFDKRLKLLCLY